jgi:hypothetical protein
VAVTICELHAWSVPALQLTGDLTSKNIETASSTMTRDATLLNVSCTDPSGLRYNHATIVQMGARKHGARRNQGMHTDRVF